jgi:formamidase
MAIRQIRVGYGKTLAEEPGTGHNRWHPDIPPAVRCEPGDEVIVDAPNMLVSAFLPEAIFTG